MKKQIRFVFHIFVLILIIQNVSAALAVTIDTDHGLNPSLLLNHAQSETIRFTIDNDQNYCSINCAWELYDESNGKVINSGNQIAEKSTPFYKSLSFTAPSKPSSKQESGTIEYRFKVSCTEIETLLWCDGIDNDENSVTITLNYDLTDSEKKDRDEVKGKLESVKNDLQLIEERNNNLKVKINNQPKNLLMDDVIKDSISYYSSYESFKNKYQTANFYQGDLEFSKALNTINSIGSNLGQELIQNYDALKIKLDERIKLHNEVVDKFNQLSKKISEVEDVAKITGSQENSDINLQFENLKFKFENGNFLDYSSIFQEIVSLENDTDYIKSNLEDGLSSAIKEGMSLIESESDKSNFKLTGFSIDSGSEYTIETLTQVCNQLNSIRDEIVEENNNKINEYNFNLEEIELYNSNLEKLKSKVEKVNNVSENVYNLVNRKGINYVNYVDCQKDLEEFERKFEENEINIENFDDSTCSELLKELNEIDSSRQKTFLLNLKLFFNRIFHIGYIDFPEIETLEVKELPEEPETEQISDNSKTYLLGKCNLKLNGSSVVQFNKANLQDYNVDYSSEIGGVIEKENMCCIFGKCEVCCEGNACLTDEDSYPTIFLHGHAFTEWNSPEYSVDAFNRIQNRLANEGFRDGGMILPDTQKTSYQKGDLGKVRTPMTFKTTYYYNVYNAQGNLVKAPSKQESIEEYSKRLGDVIETVKYRTNRAKVNVVAHSMGGLVARNYIKNYNGESSVNKLIMIGTPNHGVYGQVADNCDSIFGIFNTGAEKECAEMENGSDFLKQLNSGDETYGNVEYYTIAGSGCVLKGIDGDGISRVESVKLNGATNVKVNGKCEGSLDRDFHSNLLNPNLYPETTNNIINFLNK